jgi:hypothetical protein
MKIISLSDGLFSFDCNGTQTQEWQINGGAGTGVVSNIFSTPTGIGGGTPFCLDAGEPANC